MVLDKHNTTTQQPDTLKCLCSDTTNMISDNHIEIWSWQNENKQVCLAWTSNFFLHLPTAAAVPSNCQENWKQTFKILLNWPTVCSQEYQFKHSLHHPLPWEKACQRRCGWGCTGAWHTRWNFSPSTVSTVFECGRIQTLNLTNPAARRG